MNVEIEIKVKIFDVNELREKIKKEAKLVKTIHQVDEYYGPPHKVFFKENPKENDEYLRIRTQENKKIIGYYKVIDAGNHSEEYEVDIGDAKIMKEILKKLDFISVVTVDKKREVYEVDGFELCIDSVKDLGNFLEIEAKKDFGSPEKSIAGCKKLLKALNIKHEEVIGLGYPDLILMGRK